VVFAWCPGHDGIAENERVDVAAKSAMRSSHKQTYIDLACQDLANAAQQAITTSFKDWWHNMDPQATNYAVWKPAPLRRTHQPSPSGGTKLCWPDSGSAIPSTLTIIWWKGALPRYVAEFLSLCLTSSFAASIYKQSSQNTSLFKTSKTSWLTTSSQLIDSFDISVVYTYTMLFNLQKQCTSEEI
jgi:hypothetical protein